MPTIYADIVENIEGPTINIFQAPTFGSFCAKISLYVKSYNKCSLPASRYAIQPPKTKDNHHGINR